MESVLQRLMDGTSKIMKDTRGQYHLTLGRLIEKLEKLDGELEVIFDDGRIPKGLDSYRGYYCDLAIGYAIIPDPPEPSTRVERMTVSLLLDLARPALGKTFTGYKGGDYLMNEDTPLWCSNYGISENYAVMNCQSSGNHEGEKVILLTQHVSD